MKTRIAAFLQPQHANYSQIREAALKAEEMGVDVIYNWCEEIGRDPNEIQRSIGVDINRVDLADQLVEAGATELTLAVNGPYADIEKLIPWLEWRDK